MKILVTSTFITPFIAEDLTLLRKHHEVQHLMVHGFTAPLAIYRAVRRVDLVYSWFASTYAAIAVASARSTRAKSIIVIGGADVAALPEIGYGIWLSPWKSRLVGYAIRNADRVLAVDPYLKDQASLRAGYDGANIDVLPTGFDASAWTPGGLKQRMVLTVAACESNERLKVKGIDLLLETARKIPDVPFVLVGIGSHLVEGVRRRAPGNMQVKERIDATELLSWYRRAKVYCQPSLMEGLPNAVCESMLCGCVPVGTDVGGMRTAIGDAGVLVPYGDAGVLAEGIRKALNYSDEASMTARESISTRFTPLRREEGLLKAVNGVLG